MCIDIKNHNNAHAADITMIICQPLSCSGGIPLVKLLVAWKSICMWTVPEDSRDNYDKYTKNSLRMQEGMNTTGMQEGMKE